MLKGFRIILKLSRALYIFTILTNHNYAECVCVCFDSTYFIIRTKWSIAAICQITGLWECKNPLSNSIDFLCVFVSVPDKPARRCTFNVMCITAIGGLASALAISSLKCAQDL